MIGGIFWMIVANGAALLGAHALWRRIRTGAAGIDAIMFLVLRLLLLSAAVVVGGLSGFLTPMGLGVASAGVLAFLLLRGELRKVRFPSRPDFGRTTAILAALIAVRALAQVWFLAPSSGDALAYHLPKIGEWIRAGAFTREMGLDPCVTFPAGFELVETWWVVFLHHDLLIEVAGIEFAALAFASVAALASTAGLSPRTAFLAATLFVLTPLFTLQTTSCLNDAPVAAMVLAVTALAASRAHPLQIGIAVLMGMGLKGTFLYALSGPALIAWFWRDGERARPASIPWTIPPLLAASVLGMFWYVRNALWYGNPSYPVTAQGLDLGGVHVQVGPSLASLESNFSSLLTSLVSDRLLPYQTDSYRTAGWGVTAFASGAVGLIHAMREDRTLRRLTVGFGLSLATVLMLVSHDGWYPRFALFFPAILCVGAARLASISRPIAWLVFVGAFLQFGSTLTSRDLVPSKTMALLRQSWRERSVGPLYYTRELPAGEAVAVYSTVRSITYILYSPDFSRRVVYLRVSNAEEMMERMKREGIRYVYVDVSSAHRKQQILDLVQESRLRSLNERLYVLN
jgi:hypothetical protein